MYWYTFWSTCNPVEWSTFSDWSTFWSTCNPVDWSTFFDWSTCLLAFLLYLYFLLGNIIVKCVSLYYLKIR